MWKTKARSAVASRVRAVVAAAVGAAALCASPASAAYDDFFYVVTSDNGACQGGGGGADFADYGDGAPGGGSNDDYIVITDFCADGHGVRAWTWLNGTALGSKYDGDGAGKSVYWDPYAAVGNVDPGDTVRLRVCLVDGSTDSTPTYCAEKSHQSVDG